jgi:hypothetical protein
MFCNFTLQMFDHSCKELNDKHVRILMQQIEKRGRYRYCGNSLHVSASIEAGTKEN